MPGDNDKTTTSTNQMFPALEQGWTKALGAANTIYNNSRLPKLAPLNSDIRRSFSMTRNLARQGVPNLDALYGTQASMLSNGGMTQGMQQAAGLLGNFASGQYTEDPRLLATIERERNNATNAAATRFGGGRYGSAAIGQGLGQAQAAATDQLMLQSNENARNRQLQATGLLGQLADAGANNMATWGAMSGELNNLRYDPASRLAGVGDFLQNRTQGRIDQRANFPKQNLNWYTGILGGMGNQGSTTVNTTPGPSAAQSILGGAAMGAGIGGKIPGLGAGWGALGGGLLGLFA